MFTWVNLAFEGMLLIFIVVARHDGLSGGATGGLIAVFGGVQLAGAALSPPLQKVLSMRTIVVLALWLQAVGIAGYVVYQSIWVMLVCVLPVQVFFPTLNAVVIGYRVAITPDRLTGRVNSVARSIALSGAPLGPLAAGFLLGSFSARTAVAVFTAVLVVLAIVGTLSPSIRNAPSLSELEPTEPAFPAAVG